MRIYVLTAVALLALNSCHPEIMEIESNRRDYMRNLLEDERSPILKEDVRHLDFYRPAPNYRIRARFRATPDEATFEMPMYSGKTKTYRKYGEVDFTWQGDMQIRLSVYENIAYMTNPIYKDYLFLPFKDATNGKTTYGGGRYLNLSKADAADGEVLLDFNRCYNPWCAYSDGYNCPIPPAENHLTIPVAAGEKKYKGKVKPAPEE